MSVTLFQGTLPYNIFSTLGIYGLPILAYLTYEDGTDLRTTCKEARTAVAEYKWMDSKTHIDGSLEKWRACFRNAKAANISRRRDLEDAAFVHLKGSHTLDISHCLHLTDAAVVHLKGIHTLNAHCCNFTDAMVVHLKGIHTLHISSWVITTASIVHLKGIHTLFTNAWDLSPDRISAKDFAHLKGIHTLGIGYFCQGRQHFTGADLLGYLEGISILDLKKDGCSPIWEYDWVHESENEYMTNFNLTQYVKYAMDRECRMSDSNYAMK